MIIMELVGGVPTASGGPVSSFDRRKVESHLGTNKCGPVIYQGSPVWARDSEMGVIKNWYTGKDVKCAANSREQILERKCELLRKSVADTAAITLETLRQLSELDDKNKD